MKFKKKNAVINDYLDWIVKMNNINILMGAVVCRIILLRNLYSVIDYNLYYIIINLYNYYIII